jgi:hypothetical protein
MRRPPTSKDEGPRGRQSPRRGLEGSQKAAVPGRTDRPAEGRRAVSGPFRELREASGACWLP